MYPPAKKISSIEYYSTTPAPLYLKLDITIKTRIRSVSSPSHTLVTEIRKSRTSGMFAASSVFDGITADMDRDLIILLTLRSLICRRCYLKEEKTDQLLV